uniref:Uncharacterized protein n=1 Tax=Tanacetum cinerariifolium TaxID=118510 RepID=A0A699JLC4_TANCI|nr:hypothetical protein [Tanacetum cinerariifolium]
MIQISAWKNTSSLKLKKLVGVGRHLIGKLLLTVRSVIVKDIDYFKDFETDFPVIVYEDALETDHKISSEPTVSPHNDNDLRISFDEYDDEDYTVIYDKNSFFYILIFVNNLKTDSENDNYKVNISSNDVIVEQSSSSIVDDVDT